VEPLLLAAGHDSRALTLSGLDPADDEPTIRAANLDRHVDDVLNVMDQIDDPALVLVGHSYGGLVTACAADRNPSRVTRIVQIDAYVPQNGDSCWSLTSDRFRNLISAGAARTGYVVDPPTGSQPRAWPHPLGAFMQGARLSGGIHEVARRDFVFCSGWKGTPFAQTRARLTGDSRWTVTDVPFGHNLLQVAPEVAAAVLLDQPLPDPVPQT
jgi:pimeloyl-ACP methyl ester carboxylesterase